MLLVINSLEKFISASQFIIDNVTLIFIVKFEKISMDYFFLNIYYYKCITDFSTAIGLCITVILIKYSFTPFHYTHTHTHTHTHTLLLMEYILDRRKFLFWLIIDENWIFDLPFTCLMIEIIFHRIASGFILFSSFFLLQTHMLWELWSAGRGYIVRWFFSLCFCVLC